MQNGRSGCGVAELGGLLYAVGGISGSGETVNTAEAYDPKRQAWSSIQSMHEVGRRAWDEKAKGNLDGAGLLMDDDIDYGIIRDVCARSFLCYLQSRRSFGLAAMGGLLYACGGNDGVQDLSSLEVYK